MWFGFALLWGSSVRHPVLRRGTITRRNHVLMSELGVLMASEVEGNLYWASDASYWACQRKAAKKECPQNRCYVDKFDWIVFPSGKRLVSSPSFLSISVLKWSVQPFKPWFRGLISAVFTLFFLVSWCWTYPINSRELLTAKSQPCWYAFEFFSPRTRYQLVSFFLNTHQISQWVVTERACEEKTTWTTPLFWSIFLVEFHPLSYNMLAKISLSICKPYNTVGRSPSTEKNCRSTMSSRRENQ